MANKTERRFALIIKKRFSKFDKTLYLMNWFQQKAFQAITGLKHNDLFSLTGSQHRNLVDGELTVIGFGGSTAQKSDETLLVEGYERNAQAYSIIKKIAETGSSIPWIAKEIQRDGTLEDVPDGRFKSFVEQPNEDQTQKDFKEASFSYMLTTGDLFWEKVLSTGFGISELKSLPSQLIEVLSNQSTPLTPSGYKFELGRLKESFTLEEIVHLKYFNPTTRGIESLRGLSPLAAAWLTLSGDNQRAIAQDSMLMNRGAAGIFTNESEDPLTSEEQKEQQGLFNKMIGGAGNFNKVVAGRGKGKFLQLGMSSSDLEILKTGISNLRTLCNVYSAPSELFNDPANKTFANQKTALKSFYENAVLPLDGRILSKYNSTVVKDWSERDNKTYTVVQDLSGIGALHEDADKKAARSEKITNSIIKVVAQLNQGLTPEAAAAIISHAHGITKDEAMNFVTLLNNNNNNNE